MGRGALGVADSEAAPPTPRNNEGGAHHAQDARITTAISARSSSAATRALVISSTTSLVDRGTRDNVENLPGLHTEHARKKRASAAALNWPGPIN
jgi:hypothetical protein